MNLISQKWNSLFERERPGAMDLLLFAMLAIAIRHGVVAVLEKESIFRGFAAFDEFVVSVEPVAWVSFLPAELILNQNFHRILGIIVITSSVLWVCKRLLPWSAICSTLSYGMLISARMSLGFSYPHEFLPTVAILMAFAFHYTLNTTEIRRLIQEKKYLRSPVCPRWVLFLILLYLATYYGYGGLNKIIGSGTDMFNGLTLQLTLERSMTLEPNWAARPIVESRTIASLLMVLTVVLETGALIFLWFRTSRVVFAFGLLMMHLGILWTMQIPFRPSLLILLWLILPVEKLVSRYLNDPPEVKTA